MKLFIGILLAATIAGGFAGGEILETSFSVLGAIVGGVGTAAVLLGLGAYFDAQSKKSPEVPPEMRSVFDRMITGKENPTPQEIRAAKNAILAASNKPTRPSRPDLRIAGAIESLMAQDAEAIARGEVPERRLIPHHAIKRDIIIAAYTKDFEAAKNNVGALAWADSAKKRQIEEMQKDIDERIYGIKRLSWEELDKIIALMKSTRTDLKEIEQAVRLAHPLYKIVEPVCA